MIGIDFNILHDAMFKLGFERSDIDELWNELSQNHLVETQGLTLNTLNDYIGKVEDELNQLRSDYHSLDRNTASKLHQMQNILSFIELFVKSQNDINNVVRSKLGI